MKTNGTNQDFNVEDYENLSGNDNTTAKRVAAGAAILAGGAVLGGGVAYAASQPGEEEKEVLTTEDVLNGAEAGSEEAVETTQETVTERVVYVETKPEEPETVEPEEPTITWDETTNVYVDGELKSSTEEGTYDGHHFALSDVDGDGLADVLAVDINDNGVFESNEKLYYTESDNIRMGHATSGHENHYFYTNENGEIIEEPPYIPGEDPGNQEVIHNNFEDEKTGEKYQGDYAENSKDYNPKADIDYSEKNYLAEEENYDVEERDYSAEVNYGDSEDIAANDTDDEEETADEIYIGATDTYDEEDSDDDDGDSYTAEAEDDSSYDDMMDDECLV